MRRRRLTAAALAVASSLAACAAWAPPSAADPAANQGTPPGAPVPAPPPGVAFAPAHADQLLPSLMNAQQVAAGALASAQQQEAQAQTAVANALDDQSAAVASLGSLQGREYESAIALVAAKSHLKELAVDDFVTGGDSSVELGALLQSGNIEEWGRRQALVGTLSSEMTNAEREYQRAEQEAASAATPAANQVVKADNAVGTAKAEEASAAAALATAQSAYDNLTTELAIAQLAAPASGSDIPGIVLRAYQHAADAFALIDPSCRLTWPDLAALGRIESGNAQHGDTQLAANGDTFPPILGPPLDGSGGNQALPQPPGLPYYDGPGPWEEAVGPMQFLPTTWATSGMVGGSDTVPDPNNVFDAAMGAANYLCRAAGGLGMDTLAGISQAYLSYNHSASYVSEALSNAVYYGAQITPMPS